LGEGNERTREEAVDSSSLFFFDAVTFAAENQEFTTTLDLLLSMNE